MVFDKKMIILSGEGVTKGTLKVERNDEKVLASLVPFGLASDKYALAVLDGGVSEFYPFSSTPPFKFELNKDIDIDKAHFAVCKEGGETVMYGTLNRIRLWKGNLPKWREDAESSKENEESGSAQESEVSLVVTDIFPTGEGYDDNAVASDNYFEQEKEQVEDEEVVVEEEVAVEEKIKEEVTPVLEVEKTPEVEGRKMTFYEKNKSAIDNLFSSCERVDHLERLLPKTKWVKVPFDRERHYVVGLIGEEPDYICYGLPSGYSPRPPAGLDGYTQWLPLDVRSPHGKGYWLLYQSAKTGETVRMQPV